MSDEIKIKVFFQGNEFLFNYGSEAYIFHTALYNGMHQNYCMDEVLRYVGFVHKCYIVDDNRTSLGDLSDYVAQHWRTTRNRSAYDVLKEYYS